MANAHTSKIIFPPTGQKIEIRIEYGFWDYLLKYQPVKFVNIETAFKVLNNPNRIFSGIKRPISTNADTLCFAGIPDTWYLREDLEVSFPDNLVYAVYLNSRKSIYDFRAEEADFEDRLIPKNWKLRYGGLLWKNS